MYVYMLSIVHYNIMTLADSFNINIDVHNGHDDRFKVTVCLVNMADDKECLRQQVLETTIPLM